MHVYPNYHKKMFYFLSSRSIRMSGNSINFGEKKKKKVNSTIKAKKYLV